MSKQKSKESSEPKKHRKNTKSKGSAFERFIAKEISKWLMGGEDTEPLVWRSSNSGGTFTTNRRRGHSRQAAMASDLISIDDRADWFMNLFSIECKTGYKTASIFSVFKETKGDVLRGFWEQVSRDAGFSLRQPMLIFRPLGGSELIAFPRELIEDGTFSLLKEKLHVIISQHKPLQDMFMCRMKDFFDTYSAATVKEIFENKQKQEK
jgi:hypothetical protein